jgi:hypothetical protein
MADKPGRMLFKNGNPVTGLLSLSPCGIIFLSPRTAIPIATSYVDAVEAAGAAAPHRDSVASF